MEGLSFERPLSVAGRVVRRASIAPRPTDRLETKVLPRELSSPRGRTPRAGKRRATGFVLFVGDTFVLAASTAGASGPPWRRLAAVAFGLVVLAASGSFDSPITLRLAPRVPHLVAVSLPVSCFLTAVGYREPSLAAVLSNWIVLASGLVAARALEYAYLSRRRRGGVRERTVIVGAGHVGSRLAQILQSHPDSGLLPVGFVDGFQPELLPAPLLGEVESLGRVLDEHAVDRVIVAFGANRESDLVPVLRSCRAAKVRIDAVPRFFELGSGATATRTQDVWGIPVVRVGRAALRSVRYSVTRGAVPPRASAAGPRPFPGAVSVVIPALNEAENLPWVLERIPPFVDEVLLVDGLSTDDTEAVARAVCPAIRIVHQERRGKGAALRTGLTEARGDAVVMLDADGSMDPAEIDVYLDALAHGYDFVKGSRFMAGGGSEDLTFVRRIGNLGLMACVNVLYRSQFTDLCYGYCAFRKDALPRLGLRSDGFEIEAEMNLTALLVGLRIAEVPSFELGRRNGISNLSAFRDGRRILKLLVKRRFSASARVSRSSTSDVTPDVTHGVTPDVTPGVTPDVTPGVTPDVEVGGKYSRSLNA